MVRQWSTPCHCAIALLGGVDPGVGPAEADHVALAQEIIDIPPCLLGEPRVMRLGRNTDRGAAEQGKLTPVAVGRPEPDTLAISTSMRV